MKNTNKTDIEWVFWKICTLFRARHQAHYGVFLDATEPQNDDIAEYISNRIAEIYKIDVYINYYFLLIKDDFLDLIEKNKEDFMEDLEDTLYYEMLEHYHTYLKVDKEYLANNKPKT